MGRTHLDELAPATLTKILKMRDRYEPILKGAHSLENRIWLLWHATYLETFGQQVPYGAIPVHVVAALAEALGEPTPTEPIVPRWRMTFSAHAEKVRAVLGYRKLSGALRVSLLRWLTERARRNDDPERLHLSLNERLRTDKIVVPARYRLERLVGSARNAAQQDIVAAVLDRLGTKHRHALDRLREPRPDGGNTVLQCLKEPPGVSSSRVLLDLLDRVDFIRSLGLPTEAVASLHPDMRRRIAALVSRYSVDSLFGDFPEPKRLAYLVCYLTERLTALIDLSVECFDDLVQSVENGSKSAMQRDQIGNGRAINDRLRMFETIAAVLLDEEAVPDEGIRPAVYAAIPKDELRRAAEGCPDLVRPADFNFVDYMARRYVRRFLQTISLEGTSDATPVLDAVKAVLDWDGRGLHAAPADAPLAFVPKKWRGYACPAEGQVDRRFYELCLLEVLRACRAERHGVAAVGDTGA